jgi:predicted GNAT family acetyltransferase
MTAITDNAAEQRYELVEQGQTAYADYRLSGGRMYIDYVFSPPPLRGAGTAGRLMAGVAADAKARGLKVTPICGYAAAWLSRHPEYADLTG